MSTTGTPENPRRPSEHLRLAGLTCAIALGVVFGAFAILDLFPKLWPASWRAFPELTARREYLVDRDLVFRRRPGPHADTSFGDSFHDSYRALGVKPEPVNVIETINDEGFNADTLKGDGPVDAVLIGDSFVGFAENPDDSFGSRLGSKLGANLASYGASGTGPLQYSRVFKKYAAKRSAKLALICLFEGDDLAQTRAFLHWQNGESYQQFRLHPESGFFTRFALALDDVAGFFIRRWFLSGDGPSSNDQLVSIDAGRGAWPASFHHLPDPRATRAILADEDGRGVARAFREIHDEAVAEKLRVAIVFIPTAAHVYAPLTTNSSSPSWRKEIERHRMNLMHVERAVSEIAASEHLPLISLTPAFEAAARAGEVLYYPFDSHWNSAGRALAAKEVARQVEALPGSGVKLFSGHASGNRP